MNKSDKIPQKAPHKFTLEPKTYSWCACGYSNNMPFCDSEHKTTGAHTELKSVKFTIEETKTVWLCGCCQTSTPPFCDGTHKAC